MGGDFIGSSLVKLSTGVDFVEQVIRVSLGEYIGRIYICINRSPQYVIRKIYNL